MFDPNTACRRTAAAACVTGALLLAAGCATGTGGNPFKGIKNPLANGLRNPFHGPSEAGFFALVRKNCAAFSIGGQGLGTLQQNVGGIGTATASLYRGDLSNDEYLNLLLQEHPAADGNVPAAGCVINQLDTCLSTDCRLTSNQSPELRQAEDMVADDQQQAADEVPMAEREQVEKMIERADAPDTGLSAEP